MSFLQYLLGRRNPAETGLLLESPQSLEGLPRHELFAGGVGGIKWRDVMPPFRNQGPSTFCTAYAATAIGHAFQRKEANESVIFSAPELFFRTGGFIEGNYLVNTAVGIQECLVLDRDLPTVAPSAWDAKIMEAMRAGFKATPEMLERGKNYRAKSFAVVNPDWKSLKQALASSPLMVAIGVGPGYYNAITPKTTSYSAYHAVVLTDLVEDDMGNRKYIEIFDSITNSSKFDGFRRLAPDYEILMAFSFIDLPNEWQEIQQQAEIAVNDALDHYGKKRNLAKEQEVAMSLSRVLKFHPSLSALAGKQWTVLVNALAYGNYSMQDLLNHLTNLRRTGKPIFDLNKVRR